MNYVSAVQSKWVEVAFSGAVPAELRALGAKIDDGAAQVPFTSQSELAAALSGLQRAGFPFADEPAGWPPAAVFQQLRDLSLVSGEIRTISWTAPGKPVFGVA